MSSCQAREGSSGRALTLVMGCDPIYGSVEAKWSRLMTHTMQPYFASSPCIQQQLPHASPPPCANNAHVQTTRVVVSTIFGTIEFGGSIFWFWVTV